MFVVGVDTVDDEHLEMSTEWFCSHSYIKNKGITDYRFEIPTYFFFFFDSGICNGGAQ